MRNSTPERERLILECILWKLAAGIPWYDLPEAYPFVTKNPTTGAFDPPFSYQTIYRRCRAWRKSGLLSRILSILNADLNTRAGFDLAKALSGGGIQFERKLGRRCKLTFTQEQRGSWQHITALVLLSIAARQI